jgi:hypothetical protein
MTYRVTDMVGFQYRDRSGHAVIAEYGQIIRDADDNSMHTSRGELRFGVEEYGGSSLPSAKSPAERLKEQSEENLEFAEKLKKKSGAQ